MFIETILLVVLDNENMFQKDSFIMGMKSHKNVHICYFPSIYVENSSPEFFL